MAFLTVRVGRHNIRSQPVSDLIFPNDISCEVTLTSYLTIYLINNGIVHQLKKFLTVDLQRLRSFGELVKLGGLWGHSITFSITFFIIKRNHGFTLFLMKMGLRQWHRRRYEIARFVKCKDSSSSFDLVRSSYQRRGTLGSFFVNQNKDSSNKIY